MLELRKVGHGFTDKFLYQNVCLRIGKQDKIALVGPNGCGKSTLLGIIAGRILSDKGAVIFSSRLKIGTLDQHLEIDEKQTVLDYLNDAFRELFEKEKVYIALLEQAGADENFEKILERANKILDELIGRGFYEIDKKILRFLKGLGLDNLDKRARVATLSGGQRAKLILCKMLLEEPELLILDEPTNHLDKAQIEWLAGFLRDYEKAFLMVSHNVEFLNQAASVVWSVEAGGVRKYYGNYDAFLRQQAEREHQQAKVRTAQEKKAKVLEDFIARNSARTATAKMAQSKKKQLEKIKFVEVSERASSPHYHFLFRPVKVTKVLEVRKLAIGYDRPLLKNIDLQLNFGDKVFVSGFNGVGKTTFVKTILGQMQALQGQVFLEEKMTVGYFEQVYKWDDDERCALEEVREQMPKLTEKEARRFLAKAGLGTDAVKQSIKRLSGGEQVKLRLCKFMMRKCNFLILDEPTNHLDVVAKKALAEAINEFEGCVLCVCHEKDFCDLVQAQSVNFEDKRI